MKKNKNNSFKTTKSRVGKEHLRKFKSEDEKLLSNLSRVKKTVKLTTQSISINKDSLNITSRRLTFPELVGKSRHTSENVRNHALLGLIEFVRRYEEEGRINVYTLLQVSCSSIFNESSKLRVSSKNLLMLLMSAYFSKTCNSSCSEIIHLYLRQGIICCNGSRDSSFYDDVYGLVGLIIDRYPWVLSEYHEKLLDCLLKNTPEALSFKHFSCVYSLFKLNTKIDRNTREDLIEYVISVQYKMVSNTRVNDNYTVNASTINKVNGSRVNVISSKTHSTASSIGKRRKTQDHESNINEIECLSITSMTVKSFKLLLDNSEHIKQNDQRIVDLLLSVDLYEFENMTERGKQTYDKLFSDFIKTKIELALTLMRHYTKHHLPLLVPLIQAESLKENIESSRLAEILFKAHSARIDHLLTSEEDVSSNNGYNNVYEDADINHNNDDDINHNNNAHKGNRYYNNVYENNEPSSNGYNTIRKKDASLKVKSEWVSKILRILSDSKLKTNQQLKNYLNQLVSGTGKNEEENEEETNVRELLVNLYYESLNSMFKSVIESPSVWPFICYMKGVSPVVFKEIFDKSHDIRAYDSSTGAISPYMGTAGTEKQYRGLDLDFEQVMNHFIENIDEKLVETFIKMCLYISSNDRKTNIYYKLSEIKNLKEEEYIILSKIYLNMESSSRLNEYLSQIIMELYRKKYIRAVKEFLNVLLFQLFNIKEDGRVDRQGRVVINFDLESEIKEKVEYFMEFWMNFIKLIIGDGTSVSSSNGTDIGSSNYTSVSSSNDTKVSSTDASNHSAGDNGTNDHAEDSENQKKSELNTEENGSTQDSLINYMIKTFIDKYLMVMCNIDNNEDMNNIVKKLIEESLRPNCENIEKDRRKRVYKIIKEVLVEYIDKESLPEWVTAEFQ
ncbi:hypothetical protein MACK_002617 [Theileria orientalis]|uniref:Uncharacterized protein n=1 Tax=Theileria orientalis TaxID=68886 RepID=A0A976QTS8_THEOR|nr:hypothetical protein MACK_002617 [Theileria orientalis]